MNSKSILITGCLLLGVAVALGAFGAHGLQKHLSLKELNTFQTGIRYQFYHSFAILFAGLISLHKVKVQSSVYCFLIGILLFSGNCYLYAITKIKFIAMIIPIGGVAFIIGWPMLAKNIYKDLK